MEKRFQGPEKVKKERLELERVWKSGGGDTVGQKDRGVVTMAEMSKDDI
jgi:hypothetical protein